MKKLSIRMKITLWFSAALLLVVSITYFVILTISSQVIQKSVRNALVETVGNSMNGIEFISDAKSADFADTSMRFVEYQNGFLRMSGSFFDETHGVYTSLYQEDGTLLYGENPIAREIQKIQLQNSQVQKITVYGTAYYIFDRQLTKEGMEGLWIRGILSEQQGAAQMEDISRLSLILLPVLVLLAIGGGYLIAWRALRPIHQMSETVSHISKGGDLKKRIELGEGTDELHQLAESFNEMFGRLEKAFEAERQFASDASHELRTPMSVIMAQCEYSLENTENVEDYRQALEVISRQGGKMSKMIRDMLDFVRLEIRADSYTRSRVNMTELVTSTCADMKLIEEKGILLHCEAEDSVMVLGNSELLARLLSNLVSNAYRYGRENGFIRVLLRKNGDEAILSVTDNGIGIRKEEQEKIFHRFYQADASHSGAGTGLGLSIVSEIAKLHGGSIQVESEAGVGSSFIFSLPLLDQSISDKNSH